ncbi:isocitrate lyase/phosphoenolpyruvate mutase family protein [Streptomyces sp. NPDC057699]|uniref:isocitrate lyase/PEP mutase family protein n=1 Tax=Streptomyces sp. NPDC057699 TaxID=3346220 RepID=UPI00367C8790
MTSLHALHHTGSPLLLPNAWDHASAAALAAQGFSAIGTSSLAVAAGAGLPDGMAVTQDETLRLTRQLGNRGFLLSVDAENGFSDDPAQVAAFAARLAAAGAAGINLEDGRGDGTLTPAAVHAAKIAAVKDAVPDLFVNARTDTHWLRIQQDETEARLDAYSRAGADGVFVPGLSDPARITALVRFVDVPLNILYSPSGPGVAELGALGVRRVSLGSLLYRVALGAALDTAIGIRSGRPVTGGVPAYGDVQGLSGEGHRR